MSENAAKNASDAFISRDNPGDGKSFTESCPICGEPFKRVRDWQECCGKVACRRKKSQIKIYSEIAREVTRRFADEIADKFIEDFIRRVTKEGFRF